MSGSIVVVCGPPGVGKTTVAERVQDRTDGVLLRTDAIRKRLFSDPSYATEETAAVYHTLFDRAEETVGSDRAAILDGTFRTRKRRSEVRRLAASTDVPLLFVRVTCVEPVVRSRIEDRDGLSDADFQIHKQIKAEFEPIEYDHAVVDNSDGLEQTYRSVDEALGSSEVPVQPDITNW